MLLRLGIVATAMAIAAGRVELSIALTVGAALITLLERVAGVLARVSVDCDAHRAAARVLLEGDLLDVSPYDIRRAVDDGIYHTHEIVSSTLPLFAADLMASLLVLPIIATAASAKILMLALIAVAVVIVMVMSMRRVTQRLQALAVTARMQLSDTFLFAVEGRIEVVAGGNEAAFSTRFNEEIEAYARLMRRSAVGTALVGRAPLAVAVIAVGAVVAIDGGARAAVIEAAAPSVLVLAACVPPLLGAALGAHALMRGVESARPFIDLLRTPPRVDVVSRVESSAKSPSTFEVRGVGFRYAAESPACLRGLSFEWRAGEPLVLVGPNGSGKSTLLRLLLGLRAPTDGSISVDGVSLDKIDLGSLRRHFAYVPQRPYLGEPHRTVRDVLRFCSDGARDDAMMKSLERVDLFPPSVGAGVLDRRLGELSGGQRQRLALARALLQDRNVYFFDEPDANLDSEGVRLLVSLVGELSAAGKMVALAAHTPELASVSPAPVRL